jgi:hypothetical protein
MGADGYEHSKTLEKTPVPNFSTLTSVISTGGGALAAVVERPRISFLQLL